MTHDQPSVDDPTSAQHDDTNIDVAQAQRATRLLLDAVGEDPSRPDLVDTWQRRVPEMLETLLAGECESEKPTLCTFPSENDGLVIKTGIPVYSLCEHHLLPFHGTAHVAYLPSKRVVGLSKLARYVRWQSRRLTKQEDLTQAIATGLETELDPDVVLVELSAMHLCEAMRGVERKTKTTTRAVVGDPTDTQHQQFQAAIDTHDSG